MKILLFLIYGDQQVYHLELTYSILSALQFLKDDPTDIRIVLAADAPNQRQDLPVEHLLLTPEMLDEWSFGGIYFHAVKLHLLRHALRYYAVPVVMMDSDTIFKAHPNGLFDRFDDARALMHACEGTLSESEAWPDWKTVIDSCNGHLGQHKISGETLMYNAGVYGVMPNHVALMGEAIQILKDLRQHGSIFTMEQLAASIALSKTLQMSECRDLIEHYWHGPRAYFHYQMGQMFPELRTGLGIADAHMALPPLERRIPTKASHKITARLKRLHRKATSEYETAYRYYLGARDLRASDPELANVHATTALNILTWGLQEAPAKMGDDFALFAPDNLSAQGWMDEKLRQRWQSFWGRGGA